MKNKMNLLALLAVLAGAVAPAHVVVASNHDHDDHHQCPAGEKCDHESHDHDDEEKN